MTTTINTTQSHRSSIKGGNGSFGLRSRLVSTGAAAIAALACTAAISAPAQAHTVPKAPQVTKVPAVTKVSHGSTACYGGGGVGWSSLPFSAHMSGTICVDGPPSGYCAAGPYVSTSIAFWADPFVSVQKITKGCYHISSYGGAESMWSNIQIKVVDPIEPWNSVSGTVWLRVAIDHNGHAHYQAGASASLLDILNIVADIAGDS
jgi:hypothetical protein